jgi:hypothetical protein
MASGRPAADAESKTVELGIDEMVLASTVHTARLYPQLLDCDCHWTHIWSSSGPA